MTRTFSQTADVNLPFPSLALLFTLSLSPFALSLSPPLHPFLSSFLARSLSLRRNSLSALQALVIFHEELEALVRAPLEQVRALLCALPY